MRLLLLGLLLAAIPVHSLIPLLPTRDLYIPGPSTPINAPADDVVDLVTKPLPGWTAPLPSRWYSGFADAGDAPKSSAKLKHHYVFIESESNPAKDPIIVWTNGGPGASSLFGLFLELGPLTLRPDSNPKLPLLTRNPFAWTKLANLLIINGPPPVGFSYCDPPGPSGDFKSCGAWNDTSTARANAAAIRGFVAKHPRFKSHEWYFTGESYGGVYVPTLVRELLKDPLKIKGIAVGNACMGLDVMCWADADAWWRIAYLRGRLMVSAPSFESFERDCKIALLSKTRALRTGSSSVDPSVVKTCLERAKRIEETEAGPFSEYAVLSQCRAKAKSERESECNGDALLAYYVQSRELREALNVDPGSKYHDGDNGAGFTYVPLERDLRAFYKEDLLERRGLRVLVYSGDLDVSVNALATEDWILNLGLKRTQSWRPWSYDGRVSHGYTTKHQAGNAGGTLTFATVRAATHMVPQSKPRAAFEMLKAFIKGKDLPGSPSLSSSSTSIEMDVA